MEPGTQLGHYTVIAAIGKGGMGEVWRAKDMKLGREVAIKTLPAEFAQDADRLARFEREAKLLAALNHPNIAAIYGLEEHDDTRFLVLELVEGDTLAERLHQGAIPLEEALKLALQIAEALEAAHGKGVLHRDLKPANIKVTPEGKVKVLDFGLAKAFAENESDVTLSNSPTLSMAATQAGVILGTAAYMSPEQAKGRRVDRRSDVWAFGCVLYEMLTGRQVFAAEDVSTILARVLDRDPDFTTLPSNLHPKLTALLKRCLQKDARQRYHDIADIRLDLEELLHDGKGVAVSEPGRSSSLWKPSWVWVAVAAVVAALAVWILKPATPGSTTTARLALVLPSQFLSREVLNFAVSPDGNLFVYAGNNGLLYLRGIDDTGEPATPWDIRDASSPFFSPDGQWIGFAAQGRLYRASVSGGVPEAISDVGGFNGGSWSDNNTIYFTPNNTSEIWKVPAFGGGAAEPVTKLDRTAGEISHRWPQVLPGEKAILFTVWTGPGSAEKRVDLQILQTGERRVVAPGGNTGRYVRSGHVVYSNESDETLMAVPFDRDSLRVTGSQVRLDDSVAVGNEGSLYAVSDSGTLAYIVADPVLRRRRLAWVDGDGHVDAIGAEGYYYSVDLSPDERLAAVGTYGPREGISIYDFSRDLFSPIAANESNQFPLWHPNGRDILYRGTRTGFRNVYKRPADGSGTETQLTKGDNLQMPDSISTEGWLLYQDISPETGQDIRVTRIGGEDSQTREFKATQASEVDARFSPEGRRVAYVSDRQVFVAPFPSGEPATLVGQGIQPLWSRDGGKLFYLRVDNNGGRLMVADVSRGPELRVGSPSALPWQWPGLPPDGQGIDVSKDGRFLTIVAAAPIARVNQIQVVLNWYEELKRRVPAP